MATVSKKAAVGLDNFADLWERIGEVPLERIRIEPPPGSATEKDVLAAEAAPRKRLCELVDGVLVEKTMGTKEALLASYLGHLLWVFLEKHNLGIVLGADGMLRLFPGQVRIPDVSFIARARLPGGELPEEPIAELTPDLAIEILSPSNTEKEMARKLRDYFKGGTQLVWLIQPRTQTAKVYTSPTEVRPVGKSGALDGGSVLPGFRLSLKSLFAKLPQRKDR